MKVFDVKKGNVVEYDGIVYQVCDIECSVFIVCGGNVMFCFIMYLIFGGCKFDFSLCVDDDLKEMDLVCCVVNFFYMDGDVFVFMDVEDYIQYLFSLELVGDNVGYIVEEVEGYYVQLIDDVLVGLQVFISVVLMVVDIVLEMKGFSVIKCVKLVKFNIGIEIQVFEYISNDEKVWVNIIIGEFVGCV